jgi:putative ABC transport system permease protein
MLRDVRFGIRILRRPPSYALGVGATTAVFSVLRGALITPPPYRERSRLVLFRSELPGATAKILGTTIEVNGKL